MVALSINTPRYIATSESRTELGLILLGATFFLFSGLSATTFLDPDEGMYGSIALEMARTGDWVTPRFNGVPYLNKPPLFFWLSAMTVYIFGPSEWAVRLWSALPAFGTAILLWGLGNRVYGRPAGVLSALIFMSTVGVFRYVRVAATDCLLVFSLTLALYGFVSMVNRKLSMAGDRQSSNAGDRQSLSVKRQSGGEGTIHDSRFTIHGSRHDSRFTIDSSIHDSRFTIDWSLLFWLGMALGVLAKGLIGVLFPLMIAGLFLVLASASRQSLSVNGQSSMAGDRQSSTVKRQSEGEGTIHDSRFTIHGSMHDSRLTIDSSIHGSRLTIDYFLLTARMRGLFAIGHSLFASVGRRLFAIGYSLFATGARGLLTIYDLLFTNISGILLFLVLTLPWHVVASWRNPGFFQFYVIDNQLLRFLNQRAFVEDDVPVGTVSFLLLVLLWVFPWSLFLPASFRYGFSRSGERLRLVVGLWAFVVLGFFCFSRSKLEHYFLPAVPALSLMVGALWAEIVNGQSSIVNSKMIRWSFALGALGSLGVGIGMLALAARLTPDAALAWLGELNVYYRILQEQGAPFPFSSIAPFSAWLKSLGAALAVSVPATFLFFHRRLHKVAFASLLALSGAIFFLAIRLDLLVEPHHSTFHVAKALASMGTVEDTIVHVGPLEYSGGLPFYSGRKVYIWHGERGSLDFGSRLWDGRATFLDNEDFKKALTSHGRVLVVARSNIDGRTVNGLHEVGTFGSYRIYDNGR